MGTVSTERLATAVGRAAADVESDLIDLGASGLVGFHGSVGGWGLTDAGRAEAERRIVAEAEPVRGVIAAAYEEFLVINPVLLQVCTDWQLRSSDGPPVMNDHTDTGYDAAVLGRLDAVAREVEPILALLAATLTRFDRYRHRLSEALERVADGDGSCVADGMDSYHAVWFQLHEDLLATLGQTRW
jgi:predicted transcriptional regulator